MPYINPCYDLDFVKKLFFQSMKPMKTLTAMPNIPNLTSSKFHEETISYNPNVKHNKQIKNNT